MICGVDIGLKVGMSTLPAAKFNFGWPLMYRYQQISHTLEHTVKAGVLLLGAQRIPAGKGYEGDVDNEHYFQSDQ